MIYVYAILRYINNPTITYLMATIPEIVPESVSLSVEEAYWPRTLSDVDACDLSYLNCSHSANMIKDGMRSILRVNELPEVRSKEIDVWRYLSNYSPPSNRGFMFSYGDDRIVSLVEDNMTVGHSGSSMGWTMRKIEFIAKNGVPALRKMFQNIR